METIEIQSPLFTAEEVVNRGSSSWKADLASQYDFCIVLPLVNGEVQPKGKGYIHSLKKLGFDMFFYKGIKHETELFILLRTPLERIRSYADTIDFKLELDPLTLKSTLEKGTPEKNIAPIFINDRPDVTQLTPFDFIFGKYSNKIPENIYRLDPVLQTPFHDMVKLKLSALILESRPSSGGESLKLRRYLRMKWMLACFPLHDRSRTEVLELEWMRFPFKKLPMPLINDYFGEKVAMYFAFMEHYTQFLTVPALVGIPLQIAILVTNDFSAPFVPFYSFFLAIWAVFMLEFWKRKEKRLALQWGTLDFESNENDRSEFKGETTLSFIDGSEIRYFPSKTRNVYLAQSFIAVCALILLVAGVVASIYVIRFTIEGTVGLSNAQTLASIMNAVQIQVLNYIYSFLANALSERENHRTETQFEDSMITKIFWFQFINSYASFFFLAFIAEGLGQCHENGCMPTLALNLGIIFGIRLASGNFFELFIPYITYQYKYLNEIKQSEGKITRPEKEFLLEP
eukprot:gene5759-7950_t